MFVLILKHNDLLLGSLFYIHVFKLFYRFDNTCANLISERIRKQHFFLKHRCTKFSRVLLFGTFKYFYYCNKNQLSLS